MKNNNFNELTMLKRSDYDNTNYSISKDSLKQFIPNKKLLTEEEIERSLDENEINYEKEMEIIHDEDDQDDVIESNYQTSILETQNPSCKKTIKTNTRKSEMFYDNFMNKFSKVNSIFKRVSVESFEMQFMSALLSELFVTAYNGVTQEQKHLFKLIKEIYYYLNDQVTQMNHKQIFDIFSVVQNGIFLHMSQLIYNRSMDIISVGLEKSDSKHMNKKEKGCLLDVVIAALFFSACMYMESETYELRVSQTGSPYDQSIHEIVKDKQVPIVRKVFSPYLILKTNDPKNNHVIRKSKVAIC